MPINKTRALSLAFCFALPGPAPAAVFDLDSRSLADLPAAPAAVPLERSPLAKDWTVMFFVNGKNNLESSTLMDVNQMELVGTTPRVNVVVEMGRMNGQPEGDDHGEGDWTGVRRFLVTRDADTSRINSPVLEYRPKADMGAWKELTDFINWSKTRYPARRYALVMWDHGNGWKPVDPVNAPDFATTKGFSLDEQTGHEISTLQMTAALKAAGGVNALMYDGCNMGMASVAYEVKDLAESVAASEETEPGVVVRYAQMLSALDARPQSGAEDFTISAVRTYRDYFTAGGDTEATRLTQSAIRLARMTALRSRLDAWADAAMRAEPAALRYAKKNARIYGEDPEYKDLYNFVELVGARTAAPELKRLGAEVLRTLRSEVVISNWAQDRDSHGLSVYVPDVYDPLYDKLAWARDGRWDEFARFMAENFGEQRQAPKPRPGLRR